MRIAALVLIAGLAAVPVVALRAQSLADVAKKEEERRKEVKGHPRAYTNKDLKPVPAAPARPAEPQSAEPALPPDAADTVPPVAGTSDADADQPTAPVKDRTYWNTRIQRAREQVDRDRTLADALQTRINSLTTDFTNRDDPAQRAKIGIDRDKALSELDRMKNAVVAGEKDVAAIEEEARRAGVPPGWLR
jgi:hypothetical protein